MFSHNKTAPEVFPFCGALITRIAKISAIPRLIFIGCLVADGLERHRCPRARLSQRRMSWTGLHGAEFEALQSPLRDR